MSDEETTPASDASEITQRYIYPADHQPVFANQFVVQQNAAGEVRLSFFDVREPVIIGSTEERVRKFKEIGHVDAVCVAEVVVTKARMAQILAALLENLSKMPGKTPEKPAESSVG